MALRLLPLAIIAVLLGLFAAGLWRETPDGRLPPAAFAPYPAPALDLPLLPQKTSATSGKGQRLTLAATAGQWRFVNFFASWCAPCAVENADIMQLAAMTSGHLALIGVAYKDEAAAIRSWLAKRGNPYAATGLDHDGHAGIDWGITGVPESFLIDPRGRIVWRIAGPVDAATLVREVLPRITSHASP